MVEQTYEILVAARSRPTAVRRVEGSVGSTANLGFLMTEVETPDRGFRRIYSDFEVSKRQIRGFDGFLLGMGDCDDSSPAVRLSTICLYKVSTASPFSLKKYHSSSSHPSPDLPELYYCYISTLYLRSTLLPSPQRRLRYRPRLSSSTTLSSIQLYCLSLQANPATLDFYSTLPTSALISFYRPLLLPNPTTLRFDPTTPP